MRQLLCPISESSREDSSIANHHPARKLGESLQTRLPHTGSVYVHIKAKVTLINTRNHPCHLKMLCLMNLQVIWSGGKKITRQKRSNGNMQQMNCWFK